MTEVVVIEHSDRSVENVAKRGQLERLHLREGHEEAELIVPHVELEESSSADDLQARQLDVHCVDMAY